MSAQNSNLISIVGEIIPQDVLDQIDTTSSDSFDRQNACFLAETMSIFLLKLIQESSKAFKFGDLKKFDANPGDRGCQLRGLLIRKLSLDQEIGHAFSDLEQIAKALLANARENQTTTERRKLFFKNFFKNKIVSIQVSPKMSFLLECFLLTITKVPNKKFPSGLIVTKSDISRFECLNDQMKRIDSLFRQTLLGNTQVRVSQKSINMLRDEVQTLAIDSTEKRGIQEMLHPSKIRKGNVEGFLSQKSFGCLFPEIKAVLASLSQDNALIAVKTIVPIGEIPQLIFFKGKGSNGEFELIEDVASISSDEKIVIFEGLAQRDLSLNELKNRFSQIGFKNVILACASHSEPFEPHSSIDQIDHEQTKQEILKFQALADQNSLNPNKNPFFDLDHVFCNTLKMEIPKSNATKKKSSLTTSSTGV